MSYKTSKTVDKENVTQAPKGLKEKKVAAVEVKEKKSVPEVKVKVMDRFFFFKYQLLNCKF